VAFKRYGLYFTPEPGALADFGASWLGWDIFAGQVAQHPEIEGLPVPIAEITQTPRKYGFHGTLKPPFALATGTTFDDLLQSATTICADIAPFPLHGMTLSRLGNFLALTPLGDVSHLRNLASRLVQDLDRFRAPLTEESLAKRRANGLTQRQDELLLKWGYPYVLEEFRFHLTLSGKLSEAQVKQTLNALKPHLEPMCSKRINVKSVTLVGEAQDGAFHAIKRLPLGG